MENKFTGAEKRKKVLYELRDMLAGAAFPIMLMLILSASIISFAAYGADDIELKILILVVGEVMLYAAYVIFGKQSGVVAYRKTSQNTKKRELNSSDLNSRLYIGEYVPFKGFLIPLISCIPFIIFQIIYSASPNKVCEFALMYAFGWAYYPFNFANLSSWLNLLWIIPLSCVHGAAYIWGAKFEEKRQKRAAVIEEIKENKRVKH